MQHKYNMALQHFYHAAIRNKKDGTSLIDDFSGSEEELFTPAERYNDDCFEMHNPKTSNYKKVKKNPIIKEIQPKTLCSWRRCVFTCLSFLLFLVLVCTLTYLTQIVIKNIPSTDTGQITLTSYERFHESNVSSKPNLQTKFSTHIGFTAKEVWNHRFDTYQSRSAIRLIDINNDKINDVVMGFATSLDKISGGKERKNVCNKYNKNEYPCFGGVVAIDGKTGNQIWTHNSMHEVFALVCNGDLDEDGVADCLCAGKGGVFEAVSGKTGALIWMFQDPQYQNNQKNLFTAQFINDFDGDGILDVIQIHGGGSQIASETPGRVIFFSGKTGAVLAAHSVPDGKDSQYSPVMYCSKNGTVNAVFGTGGKTQGGNLFVIQLKDLYIGDFTKAVVIAENKKKGFTNPPVLVDINSDGVVDIISAGFGGMVVAVDGENHKVIWSYEAANTETFTTPAAGFYNEDKVLDFFVRTNNGSQFPFYHSSKVQILNGETGKLFPDSYTTSSPLLSSPLTVSMQGHGNDLFLYWLMICDGHKHSSDDYRVVTEDGVDESRLDTCAMRFDASTVISLYATNSYLGFPGKAIYSSNNVENGTYGQTVNIAQAGIIASPLNNQTNTFDVIFATYSVNLLNLPTIRLTDLDCMQKHHENSTHVFTLNDTFDFNDPAVKRCLQKRNSTDSFRSSGDHTNESMRLHRYQVTCECEKNKKCPQVLPYQQQGWAAYMGTLSNGLYNNKRPPSH